MKLAILYVFFAVLTETIQSLNEKVFSKAANDHAKKLRRKKNAEQDQDKRKSWKNSLASVVKESSSSSIAKKMYEKHFKNSKNAKNSKKKQSKKATGTHVAQLRKKKIQNFDGADFVVEQIHKESGGNMEICKSRDEIYRAAFPEMFNDCNYDFEDEYSYLLSCNYDSGTLSMQIFDGNGCDSGLVDDITFDKCEYDDIDNVRVSISCGYYPAKAALGNKYGGKLIHEYSDNWSDAYDGTIGGVLPKVIESWSLEEMLGNEDDEDDEDEDDDEDGLAYLGFPDKVCRKFRYYDDQAHKMKNGFWKSVCRPGHREINLFYYSSWKKCKRGGTKRSMWVDNLANENDEFFDVHNDAGEYDHDDDDDDYDDDDDDDYDYSRAMCYYSKNQQMKAYDDSGK